MSRLSKVFDEDLKGQVFMLRGDEGYARSTHIVAELNDDETELHDGSFSQAFNVSVFRDVGDSKVCFYANDELVKCVDWSDSYSENTLVRVDGLQYNTEYIFRVVYMGNNKCQRSSTKNIQVIEQIGQEPSTLEVTDKKVFVLEANIPLQLKCNDMGLVGGKEIIVYVDGIEDTVLTTDNSGKATYIKDFSDDGAYNLKFVFEGTEMLKPVTVNKRISMGYKILTVPEQIVFEGTSLIFAAAVTDYLEENTTYANQGIQIQKNKDIIAKLTTDNNGWIRYVANIDSSYKNCTFSMIGPYCSADVKIIYIVPEPPTINRPEIIYKGSNALFEIQTNANHKGAPVDITNETTGEHLTLTTDDTGKVNYTYIGKGQGNTRIRIDYGGNQTVREEFIDYIQYWTPQNVYNQDYRPSSNIQKLANQFKIQFPPVPEGRGGVTWITFAMEKNIPFTIKISGVTVKGVLGFGVAGVDEYTDEAFAESENYFSPEGDLSNETITLKRDKNGIVSVQIQGVTIPNSQPMFEQYPVFLIIFAQTTSDLTFSKLEIWQGVE